VRYMALSGTASRCALHQDLTWRTLGLVGRVATLAFAKFLLDFRGCTRSRLYRRIFCRYTGTGEFLYSL
jgi:hypothetical protein